MCKNIINISNDLIYKKDIRTLIKSEYFKDASYEGKPILFARYEVIRPEDIGSEMDAYKISPNDRPPRIRFMPLYEILYFAHKNFAEIANSIVIFDFEHDDIEYIKYTYENRKNWFYATPKIKVKEVKNLNDIQTFEFLIKSTNDLVGLNELNYDNVKNLMDSKLTNASESEKLSILSQIK